MKRALVEYKGSDSSSDSDDHTSVVKLSPVPKKRKALPALSRNFVPEVPRDDPALHQGRVRTVPFVAGQFCAHIYVPVLLTSSLKDVLQSLLKRSKSLCPTLHAFLLGPCNDDIADKGDDIEELHISLSRPVYLRAHQRAPLRGAVKALAAKHNPFDISFAALTTLDNDERTRAFLVCEVGAGHSELRSLAEGLGPSIRAIRQDPYYPEPRFHASIGWALLYGPQTPETIGESSQAPASSETPFPRIARFPDGFLAELDREYGDKIREPVRIEELRIRIGKEEVAYRLG